MQTIAGSMVKDLSYDTTVEAKILSVVDKDNQSYRVQTDTATFTAFATGTDTYYEDDIVYVQVPQGDYKNQKFIVGRKSDDDATDQIYKMKLPFDDFIGLKLLVHDADHHGYIANYQNPNEPEKSHTCKDYEDLNSEEAMASPSFICEWIPEEGEAETMGCTHLGLQLTLTTLLGHWRPTSGTYGLKILITGRTKTTEDMQSVIRSDTQWFINTEHMYGNTYAFYTPYVQQRVIDISNYQSITNIKIYFYQDCQFRDAAGGIIPYFEGVKPDGELNMLAPNIIIEGLDVYAGLTTDSIQDDKLFLYTYDNIFYGKQAGDMREPGLDDEEIQRIITKAKEEGVESLTPEECDVLRSYYGLAANAPIDITLFDSDSEKLTRDIQFALVSRISANHPYVLLKTKQAIDEYNAQVYDYIKQENQAATEEMIRNSYKERRLRIIWYHYEKDFLESELEEDGQDRTLKAGDHWRPMGEYTTTLAQINKPEDTESAEPLYEFNPVFQTVTPNVNQSREKYKVVTMLNKRGKKTSDILTFKNYVDVDQLNAALASNDTVILKGFYKDAKGNLVEDSNVGIFYVYDENNQVLTDTFGESYADKDYYLQLWIKDFSNELEDGTYPYIPLLPEEMDHRVPGLKVSWEWPDDIVTNVDTEGNISNSTGFKTMIKSHSAFPDPETYPDDNTLLDIFAPYEGEDGVQDEHNFILLKEEDYETFDEYFKGAPFFTYDNMMMNGVGVSREEWAKARYKHALQKITQKFRIRDTLEYNRFWNELIVTVTYGGVTYYVHKNMQFDRASSQGSEFTARIRIENPANDKYILNANCTDGDPFPFTLRCEIYDRDNHIIPPGEDWEYTWEIKNNNVASCQSSPSIKTEQFEVLDDGQGVVGQRVRSFCYGESGPIVKVTINGVTSYPLFVERGIMLGYFIPVEDQLEMSIMKNYLYKQDGGIANNCVVYCPQRIEYKADGTTPIYQTDQFDVIHQDVIEDEAYCLYPSWSLYAYPGTNLKVHNEETDGPVQDESSYDIKLTHYTKEPSQHQRYLYYNPIDEDNANDVSAHGVQTVTPPDVSVYSLYINQNSYDWKTERDSFDNLIALYESESLHLKATFPITYYLMDDPEPRTVYVFFDQPVVLTQNVYSSSLVNSWDGQELVIDEENCSILARAIAAGMKNSDNTFTGILMGDWHDNADESLNIAGIYGVERGVQTFGFMKNGKGFIGSTGKGQIRFDGNTGLISNANETCYINLNPLTIKPNANGVIDFNKLKLQGYSQYFLYCETDVRDDVSSGNEQYMTQSWIEYYHNSVGKKKNYFVVDPNLGVLTTGGVIADYGYIGNWLIAKDGIRRRAKYFKENADGETGTERYKYMFLGYDAQAANQEEIESGSVALDNQYKQKQEQIHQDYATEMERWSEDNANKAVDQERIKVLQKYYGKNTLDVFMIGYEHFDDQARAFEMLAEYFKQCIRQTDDDPEKITKWLFSAANVADFILNAKTYDDAQHAHYTAAGRPSGTDFKGGAIFACELLNMEVTKDGDILLGIQKNEENWIQSSQYDTLAAEDHETRYQYQRITNAVDNVYVPTDEQVAERLAILNSEATLFKTDNIVPALTSAYYSHEGLQYLMGVYTDAKNAIKPSGTTWSKYQTGFLNNLITPAKADQIKNEYEQNRDKAEEDRDAALDALDKWYEEQLKNLTQNAAQSYAIYAGDVEMTAEQQRENYNYSADLSLLASPMFYVRWDGTMMTRRGMIGNPADAAATNGLGAPWYINNVGLTQRNKYGIIYLGTPGAIDDLQSSYWMDYFDDPENPIEWQTVKYIDNRITNSLTQPLVTDPNEPSRYLYNDAFAIYCGIPSSNSGNTDNIEYYPSNCINFGVTPSGYLYSRAGRIGGWKIMPDKLASELDEIILDSGANTDDKIPYIRIGAMKNNKMQGKLWIADYRVLGETSDGNISAQLLTPEDLSLSGSGYNSFDGKVDEADTQQTMQDIIGQTVKVTDKKFETTSLNSWKLADDTETNRNWNLGVVLETALGNYNGSTGNTAMQIWRPSSSTSNIIASLGTTTHPWTNVYASNGFFMQETFDYYPSGGCADQWNLVATQEWVSKVVMSVLNERIKQVNNKAADALRRAKRAISNILSWCAAWDGKKFVIDISRSGSWLAGALGSLEFTVGTVKSDVSENGNYVGTMTITESKETCNLGFVTWELLEAHTTNMREEIQTAKEEAVTAATAVASSLHNVAMATLSNHAHSVTGTDSLGGSISGTANKIG